MVYAFLRFLGLNITENSSEEDIYGVLRGVIKRNRAFWIFMSIFISAWTIFFIGKGIISDNDFLFYIALAPIGIIIAYSKRLIEKGRASFWKEFSVRNGWSYSPKLDLSKESSILLKQGNSSRSAKYELRKNIDGIETRIFHYSFTIRAGKYSHAYNYTVVGFMFNSSFPNLYLDRGLNTYGVSSSSLGLVGVKIDLPSVSLPTEFEKKFKLYAPQKYEIEALQIFTPDVLAHLLDIDFKYDIELVNHELLVFIDNDIDSLEKLEKDFETAKKIRDLLAPTLNSIKFSPIGDRPHYLSR